MEINMLYQYLETVIKTELLDTYPDLNEEELKTALTKATSDVFNDEELQNEIRYKIHDSISSVYYDVIEPMRQTHFNVPNEGDVLVEDDYGRKIQLLCNFPNNGEYSIVYNDSVCPAYFVKNISDVNWQNEVSEKLHFLLRELPRNDKIMFPFVETWDKIENWCKEGFSLETLTKLEKLLEHDFEEYEDEDEAQRDYDLVYDFFLSGSHLYSLHRRWPSWIKKVDSFKKDNKCPDEKLTGVLSLTLKSGEKLKVRVGFEKRGRYHEEGKEWEARSWSAIEKGFPMFSEYDDELVNEYINKKYPIKE